MSENAGYLLGLDAGNTVIKAVLFDLEGRQIAMQALDGQSATPAPGHVERDLEELWQNARTVIRRCIDSAGIASSEILGIGCAGHGNGLYLLDGAGAPLLGIQSLDSRAGTLAQSLAQEVGAQLHDICLQKPWAAQTPVLLAWVKAHRPELYERAGSLVLCKDFITFRLTGQRVSDVSDMSGCGLLRLPECCYDDALLDLYGLSEASYLLPRLCDPAEVIGAVTPEAAAATGLAPGTPVIAGFFDVVSSAMGSGVVREGEASLICGSWSINQVFSRAPLRDPDLFMVAGFGKKRFVSIEASATSAANLEWYVRRLVERGAHHDDPFGHCNAAVAAVTPAPDDPFFLPFLYGSGPQPEARAAFVGLAGWHEEAHLLRALYEGVMFEHRRHVEVLAGAGVHITTARLSGGGARSPVWPQIFADGLGVTVALGAAEETGALGAAIGAGLGVGLFASYEAGLAAMTRSSGKFVPDPALRAHYDKRYARYRQLCDVLAPAQSEKG